MAWYRHRVRRVRRASRRSRRRPPYGHLPIDPDDAKRAARKAKRWNKKHKVVGATPDYWVSPIDAVPGVAWYTKGKKVYKSTKKAVDVAKFSYRKWKSRRRGQTSSSPNGRKRRRRQFYYYRGKRYWRKGQ